MCCPVQKGTVIDCSYNTKEELVTLISKIPVGRLVKVTTEYLGYKKSFPIGKLHNKENHGEWYTSFFWENGEYCQYVWLKPSFDYKTYSMRYIEVLD